MISLLSSSVYILCPKDLKNWHKQTKVTFHNTRPPLQKTFFGLKVKVMSLVYSSAIALILPCLKDIVHFAFIVVFEVAQYLQEQIIPLLSLLTKVLWKEQKFVSLLTFLAGWRSEVAGCRSTLSMSKIKVKISKTKFLSFYMTLLLTLSVCNFFKIKR